MTNQTQLDQVIASWNPRHRPGARIKAAEQVLAGVAGILFLGLIGLALVATGGRQLLAAGAGLCLATVVGAGLSAGWWRRPPASAPVLVVEDDEGELDAGAPDPETPDERAERFERFLRSW